MIIVDSHCHLDNPRLAEDESEVVSRAREAGVRVMQTIGTKLSTFARTREVAERHDNVYCSIGVHPHEAGSEGISSPEPLLAEIKHPKVIGIGESGLDYYYDKSPRDRQADNFRAHIEAAREAALPLIIHTRDADEDTAAILEDEMAKGIFAGVVHCFSSSRRLAERATEVGLFLGIGGMLTFNRSDELRAIVADMPHDRIILETDAPYLAPVPYRGKINEPAYTRHVAERLAEVWETDIEEVARVTTANFFRLFNKAEILTVD
ncbi:MAG: TatD family hydrolase [Pseudomonadota bacterium]